MSRGNVDAKKETTALKLDDIKCQSLKTKLEDFNAESLNLWL
jgi:hypothetical protein